MFINGRALFGVSSWSITTSCNIIRLVIAQSIKREVTWKIRITMREWRDYLPFLRLCRVTELLVLILKINLIRFMGDFFFVSTHCEFQKKLGANKSKKKKKDKNKEKKMLSAELVMTTLQAEAKAG